MSLTDAQKFRAGRAILEWTQDDLAARAGISKTSISWYEKGQRQMQHNNKMACWHAFADAGVFFNHDTIQFVSNINPPPATEPPHHAEEIRSDPGQL